MVNREIMKNYQFEEITMALSFIVLYDLSPPIQRPSHPDRKEQSPRSGHRSDHA